ncbi:MAG: 4-alpha-glucanotransferase [Ruminococcaceae bacterium]|nr:4-alpha-glucanotransferase [Oscillospiraceae bacterium]
MERKSGVLMHITSLFGDYSSGSFGKCAKEFIDFLKKCKFSYWQVLPFLMADGFNSPYQSYSAFSSNPYFIDLDILFEKGLITKDELLSNKQTQPYSTEYEILWEKRFDLLNKASKRVIDKTKINDFISSREHIENFCVFMAKKEANDNKSWHEWENDLYSEETLFMWKFIQYEFISQWKEIKKYANDNGIKIIGDIPIYVSYDSSDVWANKDEFLLDEDNLPVCVAGVPPDYFSQDGQLWGNPLYNWDKMKKNGYKWWIDRMSFMAELFDGVRIDHFRGLESFWAVPYGSKTAKNGEWKKGPGMDLINKLNEKFSDKLIIAEDLGEITPQVIKLVEDSGYPGIRVFQFGFLGDDDNPHMPHNYINNSVVYTGTHDNNTLLGYMWELPMDNKKRMLEYCNYISSDWEGGYDSILRSIFASNAGIVILPIQDLLGYGGDTRMNVPGRADGNWRFRITKEQLNSIDISKFKRLNELYKR